VKRKLEHWRDGDSIILVEREGRESPTNSTRLKWREDRVSITVGELWALAVKYCPERYRRGGKGARGE